MTSIDIRLHDEWLQYTIACENENKPHLSYPEWLESVHMATGKQLDEIVAPQKATFSLDRLFGKH